MSIFYFKNLRIIHIIKQVKTLVVMNTQTTFLNKRINRSEIDMQTRSQSYWPQGTMGGAKATS